MQAAKSIPLGRSLALHASTSRLRWRSPNADRYLAIHDFFTRQAHSLARGQTPTASIRQQVRWRRFNSSHATASSSTEGKPCPNCPPSHDRGIQRGHAQEYTPFIRRLIQRTQSISHDSPHRPTKEQLLGAARGRWERFRIRMQWFFIRGWRRFNADDFSAFASLFVFGNTLWILIGTTTFVSAIFATLNSLSLQEYVARYISDYLTSETGVNVLFESAIVPKWGASTICFRNVYVSRRSTDSTPDAPIEKQTKKTKTTKAPAPRPFLSSSLSPDTYYAAPAHENDNYTMFDINLEEVEVTLSFMRWLDGKGLVKDAKVKGVRGVVDRRSVWWDTSKLLSPADYRHATHSGDFELESLQVEDALLTVYQPGGQRPYNVSVFNATIGPFRKRWLFYDLMSAEGITGQFDNCLFSLHMPQKLGKAGPDESVMIKRMARFRIDGLPIEHAQYATGHTGPISWITSGKLDAVLDIKFPHHPDDQVDIKAIFEEIGRNVATITHHGTHPEAGPASQMAESVQPARGVIPGQPRLARPPLRAPTLAKGSSMEEFEEKRQVTVDIDLRFRDLKAAVPIYTSDLSVTNNAFIRPIVAFINANRTLVPIHCQVDADLNDFDGSWTLFETGLMSSISNQMYDALIHHVGSETANSKRIRQVSYWGIQKGAEVLLDTLRNVVDPAHGQLTTI